MAKFQSTLIEQASGKLGENIVMRQTAAGKILCKAPKKASTPRRSEKQAYTRLQMANLLANYRLYSGKLVEAFENKKAGVHDANMYVSANWGHEPVYLTRSMRIQGACVLAENLFCIGGINPIGYELNGAGKLVTTLNLGIEITATTTVAQFSTALIQTSDVWEEGDQLTFFLGTQYIGSDNLPRATMRSQKVILSLDNQAKLWDVVSSDGFSTVDGYLATGVVLNNSGAAWVHSRNQTNGATKVSTQRLVVVSDVLAEYQSYAAMMAAADSYGGINSKAVYLNPQSSLVNFVGGDYGVGDNTGNNTGGGQQTVTVAAPTVSGTTPFNETTQVTMSAESGATIYYTTDGSTPTSASTQYSSAITLSNTTTVKAVAVKNGVTSTVASQTFTKSDNGGGGNGDAD